MMMMVISGGDNSCNGDSGGHGLPMMIMYITGTSSLVASDVVFSGIPPEGVWYSKYPP